MRLTQRQLLFVEHYIQSGGRGAQAAKAAGYTGNPGTLAAMATQNLNTPHVRDEIRRRQDEIKFRSEIDTQAKRMKLWAIAQAHRSDNPDAAIKAIAEMNRMDGDYKDPRQTQRVSIEDILRMVVPG